MSRTAFGLVCVLLFSLSMLAPAGEALEIRVAPPDRIFLNDSGRRVGIRDVLLQNIAVVNDGEDEVELQRMEITVFRYGQPVLTDAIAFHHYPLRWQGLKEYFDRPRSRRNRR